MRVSVGGVAATTGVVVAAVTIGAVCVGGCSLALISYLCGSLSNTSISVPASSVVSMLRC